MTGIRWSEARLVAEKFPPAHEDMVLLLSLPCLPLVLRWICVMSPPSGPHFTGGSSFLSVDKLCERVDDPNPCVGAVLFI